MSSQITSKSNVSETKDTLLPMEVLGGSKYGDNKSFAVLSSAVSFLPRVQLYGANSGLVKRGKIGMGQVAP